MCSPVYDASDIYDDRFFRERELLVAHVDEVHDEMTVPGVVPKLSDTPGSIRQAARWTVGADTEQVLGELGVEGSELARLREDGVV